MDAGDDRLGDEGRARSRDELPRRASADLDVDAGGCEHDAVGVVARASADLVVERAAQLEAAAELALVLRERAIAVTRALPRRLDVDVEDDDELVAQQLPNLGRLDRAAADRDDRRPRRERFPDASRPRAAR